MSHTVTLNCLNQHVKDECNDYTLCPQHNSNCINSDGSFACSCNEGFERIEDKCENIDECQASNWTPGVTSCISKCGGIAGPCPNYCQGHCCKEKFPKKCPEAAIEALTSKDVSQCLVGPCSSKPYSHCKDNIGSYDCECNPGYEYDESLNQCLDIDECTTGTHDCPKNSICSNLSSKSVFLINYLNFNLNSESPDRPPCTSYCSPTLHVKADCQSQWERNIITGEYVSVGGYGGRTIYQKTTKDSNGHWWSMFYDDSKWIFKFQGKEVIVGETSFSGKYKSEIQSCIDKTGQ